MTHPVEARSRVGNSRPPEAEAGSSGHSGRHSITHTSSSESDHRRDSATSAANVRLASSTPSVPAQTTGSLTPADRGIKPTPMYATGGGRVSSGPGSPSGGARDHSRHSTSVSGDSSSDYSSLSYGRKNKLINADNICANCINKYMRVPTWYTKMRPRYRQVLFCLISEIIIAAALALQFEAFRGAMHKLLQSQAKNELKLMDMTYTRKNDQLSLIMQGWVQNPNVVSFIKGHGTKVNYTSDTLTLVMKNDLTYLNVEYGMMIDANARIVIDINTNRTGERFDPYGIVSRVLAHPEHGVLQVARRVSWNELLHARVPTYRELYSNMNDNDRTHPRDTKESSVMRYVVTPVFSNVNGTGACLGVFLTGDILNGKTPVPYLVTMAFQSGFSGIYTLNGDGSKYLRASTRVWLPDCKPKVAGLSTSTFDPMSPSVERKLLKEAAKHPGETVSFIDEGFAWAATTATNGMRNGTLLSDEVPEAIMVRALFLANDHTFTDLLSRTWYFLCAMLLINVLSVYFSASTFIAPLEEVAATLKARMKAGATGGQKIAIKELASLDLYANYLLRVLITIATALTCSICIAYHVKNSMQDVVDQLTLSELGIAKVSYNYQLDLTTTGVRSMAFFPGFKRLAQSPNNTALLNVTKEFLKREKDKRKLTFLAVTDKNNKVISAINTKRIGTNSDPGGVATDTLRYNVMYSTTNFMTYAEFAHIGPTWQMRHLLPDVPDSMLSPYNTRSNVILRWSTAPIYTYANTDQAEPDAVIVGGDLINGQTATSERMLMVTGVGFVAHYTEDGRGGFDLLNSVLIDRDTRKAYVDLELPSDDVLQRSSRAMGKVVLGSAKINGKDFAIAVSRTPVDRYVSASDGQLDMDNDPVAYVVYGKDKATTKDIEHQQQIWVICMALLQISMMLLLSYSAYLPFHKLLTVLEDKGFADRKNRPTILKVIKVYIIDAMRNLIRDLRSRTFAANVRVYIGAPVSKRLRRLQRRWRHIFGHGKSNKKHHREGPHPPKVQQRGSTSSASRTSRIVPEQQQQQQQAAADDARTRFSSTSGCVSLQTTTST